VPGALLLTGASFCDRASVAIWGAGTGLNLQRPVNTWRLFCSRTAGCICSDAFSNRSDWTSCTSILVPCRFSAQNGVATRVEDTLDIAINASI
jgi:hypothetical protein